VTATSDRHETVLVAASLPRDAELTADVLRKHGFAVQACDDVAGLARHIGDGAGIAVVTEELLDASALRRLGEACAGQPPWSDFPFVVFSSTESTPTTGGELLRRLEPLGNVTLLERPVRISTLVSTTGAALRSRRRQYEVRGLLGQLEDAVRQRDQFLAMLGHELRNPLSAMLTAAHVVELLVKQAGNADLEASFARHHAIIKRQGKTLTRLMDDLLDVSRLTTGKVRIVAERLDLREVLVRVVDTMGPLAARRGVRLVGPPVMRDPIGIVGDATRLEQVLHNLVHNAVKYTGTGGTVEIHVDEGPSRVEVAVRDTGAGIEADVLPRIFDLFRQVDSTLDRADGGLGLGLTLAKSLVELHGGTLVAESPGLGHGSTFRVRLPRPVATAGPLPSKATGVVHAVRRRFEGLSVFVLEDREDNRDALVVALGALGCEVEAARNGVAGVDRIVKQRPQAALVDIGLPGLDGYEVARRVRAAIGNDILLVALTGYGQEDDRRRAREAGFDVHLTKPVDLDRIAELLSTIPA
jgi:signal transduction histidine kinase/CheY-like chemotaxis protein